MTLNTIISQPFSVSVSGWGISHPYQQPSWSIPVVCNCPKTASTRRASSPVFSPNRLRRTKHSISARGDEWIRYSEKGSVARIGRAVWWGRTVPITPADPFKWKHYPGEVILLCVRWYLRFPFVLRPRRGDDERAGPPNGSQLRFGAGFFGMSEFNGGRAGTRTPDLLRVKQAL